MTPQRFSVNDLLHEARATLVRMNAQQAYAAQQGGALILDTRTEQDRDREGVIPGSIHTPLSVIQWVADPAPGYQHPAIHGFEQTLIVVCNEGYSSSLAAASLKRLGFVNATDLNGGYRGWKACGLPTIGSADNIELRPAGGIRRRSHTLKALLYAVFLRMFQ